MGDDVGGVGERESIVNELATDDFLELSNDELSGEGDLELLPNEESLCSLDESSLFGGHA